MKIVHIKVWLFVFAVFFLNKITAQVAVNVYWTEDTERSGRNNIYYSAAHLLSWPDFTGKPVASGPEAAMTTSGFGYKADMKSSGGKGQVNVGVYCFFNKDRSWVKTGRNTPYILNHEQHHFDVSFLAANLFMERIRKAGLTPSNCNTLLPKIYTECCDIMNNMQNDYDEQTQNSIIEPMQKKWDGYINNKLAAITN